MKATDNLYIFVVNLVVVVVSLQILWFAQHFVIDDWRREELSIIDQQMFLVDKSSDLHVSF